MIEKKLGERVLPPLPHGLEWVTGGGLSRKLAGVFGPDGPETLLVINTIDEGRTIYEGWIGSQPITEPLDEYVLRALTLRRMGVGL